MFVRVLALKLKKCHFKKKKGINFLPIETKTRLDEQKLSLQKANPSLINLIIQYLMFDMHKLMTRWGGKVFNSLEAKWKKKEVNCESS